MTAPNIAKGERVAWLLWDAGMEMPRYQPAILKLLEARRALPKVDRTEEQDQVRTWVFKEWLEWWIKMEAWDDVWFNGWQCERRSLVFLCLSSSLRIFID